MTKEQLLKCYDLTFEQTHSDGFKTAEMKDLLYEKDYYFITKPKENWKDNIISYLNDSEIDISKFEILLK